MSGNVGVEGVRGGRGGGVGRGLGEEEGDRGGGDGGGKKFGGGRVKDGGMGY